MRTYREAHLKQVVLILERRRENLCESARLCLRKRLLGGNVDLVVLGELFEFKF